MDWISFLNVIKEDACLVSAGMSFHNLAVSGAVKGQLYKTMVRLAMSYVIETLAVAKAQERKVQVAEMKILRWSLVIKK